MVSAWIYNESMPSDPRQPHQHTPHSHFISTAQLAQHGILQWHLTQPQQYEIQPLSGELGEIRKARDYKNHDIIAISPKTLPNYDSKLKMFFTEHLHEDEEIRFCLEGSGYFDIRSDLYQYWIRIHVTAGDMIVLPAGCYHRFIVDEQDYIKAMRLFKDAPKWEALNRSEDRAEKTEARKEYLQFIEQQKNKSMNGVHTINGNVTSSNGIAFIRPTAAASLANYPHMRSCDGMLYLSGLSSRRVDGSHQGAQQLTDGSWELNCYEQTKAVLQNIEAVLAEAKADRSHIVDCTCYLADMSYYGEFNRAYNEFFTDPKLAPTRTTVAVKQLPHPNLLVEIKAVAVQPL